MLKLTPSGKSFSASSGKYLLANVFWQMSSGKCLLANIQLLKNASKLQSASHSSKGAH